MIKVEGLSKRYARTVAVDNISFEVQKGEIVGFLGPNGAGKTTTMRVLTCFLPPTSGTANVAGFDVVEKPMEVKKRIGYLPETPPVYPEMEVADYLSFVAKLWQRWRITGSCATQPHGGGRQRNLRGAKGLIRAQLAEHPALTLAALCERVASAGQPAGIGEPTHRASSGARAASAQSLRR